MRWPSFRILLTAAMLWAWFPPCHAQVDHAPVGKTVSKETNSTDMAPIAATVVRMLEQGHYLHPLSLAEKNPPRLESEPAQSMAERVLKNYLQILDYYHLYFTQADVDEFMKRFAPGLASDIARGDLSAPREIFTRFRQRVEERVATEGEVGVAHSQWSGVIQRGWFGSLPQRTFQRFDKIEKRLFSFEAAIREMAAH